MTNIKTKSMIKANQNEPAKILPSVIQGFSCMDLTIWTTKPSGNSTYFHVGLLAIHAAVTAKVNIR